MVVPKTMAKMPILQEEEGERGQEAEQVHKLIVYDIMGCQKCCGHEYFYGFSHFLNTSATR